MTVSNHELTVRRGETFTLDKLVQNRDGSPYIISSEMQNPYFLLTVSSALYEQEDTYVYHGWLPIPNPRFYSTSPVRLNDFKKLDGNQAYHGFDDMSGPPSGWVNGVHIIYGAEGSNLPCYDALFYYEDDDGNREYKWWSGENGWQPYVCRIVHKFLPQYTKDWIERSYFYNIDLVDGVKNPNAGPGDIPLLSVSEMVPILEPTKMAVLSNLKGGIKWLK